MTPMQDNDNGVCIHHESMCNLIKDTHTMTKNMYDKLMGTLDKKGVITEHYEMYEIHLDGKKDHKGLYQGALGYIITAVIGGAMALIVIGIKAAL